MNLCMCGAQASYPHAKDCPRPLFNAPVGSLQEERWIADRKRLRDGDKRYAYPGHERCPGCVNCGRGHSNR